MNIPIPNLVDGRAYWIRFRYPSLLGETTDVVIWNSYNDPATWSARRMGFYVPALAGFWSYLKTDHIEEI